MLLKFVPMNIFEIIVDSDYLIDDQIIIWQLILSIKF